MPAEKKSGYRKNFSLIFTFILMMTVLFGLSLLLAYRFSTKFIENQFVSEKVNVLEKSIKPYNDFFQKKLPEVSYYNGYLDSATASNFVDTLLMEYPFVSKVIFYDSEVKNTPVRDGLNTGRFSIGPKRIYQFGTLVPTDSVELFSKQNTKNFIVGDDFNALALKLATYIESLDTNRTPNQDELFSNFSNVRSNKITYLNIPRLEDLKMYKMMIRKELKPQPVYQQDMLSFHLDPYKIRILNSRPLLYQHIRIEPLTYDPLETGVAYMTTEITLPGPFSDYKLYFISAQSFINKEIFNYFLPLALGILAFYSIVVLLAYLIFRNLNINHKMFKLQYDFMNNLTHEFKTPVSVIKIAG
ncbi:MAG: sensor histidine kinase, partial [Pedobacter sp.]